MKNNGNFKNAGSSRAKTWRNILLILGAVALIASYIADIRDPHPGTETQDNRPFVEQALKDGFQTLHARVTRVADGDTVYIKDDEGKEARVRLLGIDAPESKQAYGVQSAEHLKRNLRDAEYHVQVIYRGRDQYGRIIGKLVADGKDLNLDQVSTGNAWVYRNYLKDLQPGDKNLYLKAEDNALAISLRSVPPTPTSRIWKPCAWPAPPGSGCAAAASSALARRGSSVLSFPKP